MLSIQGLTYKVGSRKILSDINCNFDRGKFHAIIGANGSGKSTLLKFACRILNSGQSKILLDGRTINDYSPQELAIKRGVLLQNNVCSEQMTVKQIVELSEYLSQIKDESYKQFLIDYFQIRNLLNQEIGLLSGGEQQRVHACRVLYQIGDKELENKVLFLDEPTSAADLNKQFLLLDYVRRLCDNKNLTVVSVLHDMNLVFHYSDKVLGLKNGITTFSNSIDYLARENALKLIFDADFEIIRNDSEVIVIPRNLKSTSKQTLVIKN